jgi:acetyltransferase
VTIGNNVIIGAGSIVTRDIPSGSVAVGCPAKVVDRFEDSVERYILSNSRGGK